jgi:hypothetical protein
MTHGRTMGPVERAQEDIDHHLAHRGTAELGRIAQRHRLRHREQGREARRHLDDSDAVASRRKQRAERRRNRPGRLVIDIASNSERP